MSVNVTVFTIQNNTSNELGPFGLGQLTIAANATVNVTPPLNGLLADNNFLLAIASGELSILIGPDPVLKSDLFPFFALLGSHNFSNDYCNISGNGTNVVKSSSGILHAVIVGNNTTGGTITIYDNTEGSGTVMMEITIGSPTGGLLSSSGQPGPIYLNALNVAFYTGLTVVTSGSSSNNITLIYQ